MTFLQTPQDSRMAQAWDVRTLEPPRLSLHSLAQDLSWEVRQLRASQLTIRTSLGFLILRVLQRIAYNAGWSMGE